MSNSIMWKYSIENKRERKNEKERNRVKILFIVFRFNEPKCSTAEVHSLALDWRDSIRFFFRVDAGRRHRFTFTENSYARFVEPTMPNLSNYDGERFPKRMNEWLFLVLSVGKRWRNSKCNACNRPSMIEFPVSTAVFQSTVDLSTSGRATDTVCWRYCYGCCSFRSSFFMKLWC